MTIQTQILVTQLHEVPSLVRLGAGCCAKRL